MCITFARRNKTLLKTEMKISTVVMSRILILKNGFHRESD